MALVSLPNIPLKGEMRCHEAAWCQSTVPAKIGMRLEPSANKAASVAMGTATLAAHFRPHRLMPVKMTTKMTARSVVGTPGRYHWWMAPAEKIAVRPQVGTQPHQ